MLQATIIGAEVLCGQEIQGLSLEEMIYRAVQNTLNHTLIDLKEVDQVAIASSDGVDGRAISSMVTAGSVGAYRKSIINSSSSGEHALILAALEVMAGRSRLCLVANWAKPSEAPLPEIDRLNMDPFFYRPLPVSRVEMLELQVRAMAAAVPTASDWIEEIEIQGVGGSPNTKSRDGAAVLILAEQAFAKERKLPHSMIRGFGWATDSYWRGGPELAELPSLKKAADRAYSMAGIKNPTASLDFIEVMDFTPLHLLMICRALGFCEADSLAEFADSLRSRSTKVQINPSGKFAFRNLDFAAGLAAVVTTHRHLFANGQGEMLRNRRGLAHAASANAAQSNSVFVLEREE
jgi:acetyl-CoA C-acetyltransferase